MSALTIILLVIIILSTVIMFTMAGTTEVPKLKDVLFGFGIAKSLALILFGLIFLVVSVEKKSIQPSEIEDYCKDRQCFGKQKVAEMLCYFDGDGEEICLRVNTFERQYHYE